MKEYLTILNEELRKTASSQIFTTIVTYIDFLTQVYTFALIY